MTGTDLVQVEFIKYVGHRSRWCLCHLLVFIECYNACSGHTVHAELNILAIICVRSGEYVEQFNVSSN